MNRTEKEQTVAALRSEFSAIQGAVVADFHGITVKGITQIRRLFREEGVSFRVVKNSLAKIAMDATSLDVIKDDFVGPTALAYSLEDPVAAARVASQCSKDEKNFEIRCGYIDNTRLDLEGVEQLAKLPGRDELRAKLLSVFKAPATKLVATMHAVPQQVVLLLSAYKDKLESES